MDEATIVFVIIVFAVLWLLGMKKPLHLIGTIFLLYLLWQVFYLHNGIHAGATIRHGLHDLMAFLKSAAR